MARALSSQKSAKIQKKNKQHCHILHGKSCSCEKTRDNASNKEKEKINRTKFVNRNTHLVEYEMCTHINIWTLDYHSSRMRVQNY